MTDDKRAEALRISNSKRLPFDADGHLAYADIKDYGTACALAGLEHNASGSWWLRSMLQWAAVSTNMIHTDDLAAVDVEELQVEFGGTPSMIAGGIARKARAEGEAKGRRDVLDSVRHITKLRRRGSKNDVGMMAMLDRLAAGQKGDSR